MNFRNSEIEKYYWQSFSLQRVIAMPFVILAVVFLILIGHQEQDLKVWGFLSGIAYFAYYIVVFLWGGYQAAHALAQEVKENTWDNQRLSSVSPWELTVGKLFGSTLYSWYGGVLLLAVYGFAAVHQFTPSAVALNIMFLLITGMLCHATALLSSLIPLKMQAGRDSFHVIGYLILGLLASGFFLSMAGSYFTSYAKYDEVTQWFQIPIPSWVFLLASISMFLIWTVWGIYRFMRQALQFKNTPAVWGLFILFCMVYWGGFKLEMGEQTNFYWMAYLVGAASLYFSLFSENLNITRYRTFFHHRGKKLMQLLPMWVVSLGLTALAGLLTMLTFSNEQLQNAPLIIAGSLLFILRDICIFHYFLLVPNGRLPLLAALFYLAVLYLLLPGIVLATGLSMEQIGYVFYPVYIAKEASMLEPLKILPAVIQLIIAVLLLKGRYQKMNASLEQ